MAKAYTASAPGDATAVPTTRRTRSQSAKPQEAARTRGVNNRQNSAEPPDTTAKQDGRKTKAKNTVEELPTLDENAISGEDEAEAAEQDVAQALIAEQLNIETPQPSPRRTSGASGFSGTTAKTSFSQEEINKLDPDVICDVLPDAYAAAERLTQLLLPNGLTTPLETWKEIKRAGSKHNKLYLTRWESLRVLRPILTSVEYIEPSHVLRSLLNVQAIAEVQPAVWRPDDILYRINMALMLRAVLVTCDPSHWTEEATGALESLDMAFPTCIAGGQLDFYALELWLEIAAHVTIRRVEAAISSGSSFSPLDEIDNVFLDSNEEFKHFRAFGFATADEEDSEQGLAMIERRIAQLKDRFGEDGTDATAINGHLKAQFRWDDLRSNTLRYYVARLVEVNRHIEAAGGVEAIVIRLEQEAERVVSEKLAEQMKQQYTTTGTTPRQSLGSKSALALLKGREKEIMQQPPTPGASMPGPDALSQSEDVMIHDFGAHDDQEGAIVQEEELPAAGQSTAQQAVAKFDAAQKQSAKRAKARLIDRQVNAIRIGSDMFEDTQPEAIPATSKRSHVEMEDQTPDDFDPTQDGGFENDVRDHSNAAQRREEVAFQQGPQRAPQRFETIEPRSSPMAGPSTATQPSPAKRPRKNPGSAIPPPRPRLDPEAPRMDVPVNQIYKQAKVEAQYNRVSSSQARPPQIRQPWSDEEESALIDLIVEHVDPDESISYSKLKAKDDELQATDEAKLTSRTAEDIRFKARNMKLTLLLAERKLPRNWNKVILDKKAITKLHSRGIEYTQERIRAERRRINYDEDATPTPGRASVGVNYTTGGVV